MVFSSFLLRATKKGQKMIEKLINRINEGKITYSHNKDEEYFYKISDDIFLVRYYNTCYYLKFDNKPIKNNIFTKSEMSRIIVALESYITKLNNDTIIREHTESRNELEKILDNM